MKIVISELAGYIFGNHAEIKIDPRTPQDKIQAKIDTRKQQVKATFQAFLTKSNDQFYSALMQLQAEQLIAILFDKKANHNNTYPLPSLNEIKLKYQEFNQKYNAFKKATTEQHEANLKLFSQLFYICKLVSDFIEETNHYNANTLPFMQAYQLFIMFGNTEDKDIWRSIDYYIHLLNLGRDANQLHDALSNVTIPNLDKIDLIAWRRFIKKHNPDAVSYFSHAQQIARGTEGAPNDLDHAKKLLAEHGYVHSKKHLELSQVCTEYDVSEEMFNASLKALKIHKDAIAKKKSDNLPDISIDGATINHPNYHFVKLPIGDCRALVLGEITNCCQSIGEHSEECVIDGITRPNNGFYVLLKKTTNNKIPPKNKQGNIQYDHYQIVGQGYAWRGMFGTLVFDSWESRHRHQYDAIAIDFLKEFGKQITASNETDVFGLMVGSGGKTPKDIKVNLAESDIMREGEMYGDAKTQFVIAMDKNKKNTYAEKLNQALLELTQRKHQNTNTKSLLHKAIAIAWGDFPNLNIESSNISLKTLFRFFSDIPNLSETIINTDILLNSNSSILPTYNTNHDKKFLSIFAKLVKKNSNLINYSTEYLYIISEATRNGHLVCLNALLEAKADPNIARYKHGHVPIDYAIEKGHADCLAALLNAGADIKKVDKPLINSVKNGHTSCVKILAPLVDNINDTNYDNMTALMCAARRGDLTSLNYIIAAKADVNFKTDDIGRTQSAIYHAVSNGHAHCLQSLLNAGAKPDPWGDFIAAANGKNVECLKILYPYLEEKPGQALANAVEAEDLDSVNFLIEKGFDLSFTNRSGETLMMIAAKSNHAIILQRLIEAGMDVNESDYNGLNALSIAAGWGKVDCLNKLLKAGAATNQPAKEETPLMAAASSGHYECLTLLINSQSDLDVIINGETALSTATKNGYPRCIKILLDAHANPFAHDPNNPSSLLFKTIKNWHKKSDFYFGEVSNYSQCFKILIESGIPLNGVDEYTQRTALMLAITMSIDDCAKTLVNAHADINCQDADGKTALMIAIEKGNVSIATYLIKAGADILLKDKTGKTAEMLAKGNPEIQILFSANKLITQNIFAKKTGTQTNKVAINPAEQHIIHNVQP